MRRVIVAAAALVLAACVAVEEAPPPRQPQVVVTPPPVAPPAVVTPAPVPSPPPERPSAGDATSSEVEALLADFARMRRLPASDLPREQDAARMAFYQSKSDAARVRLAMATTMPGSAPGEEQRALELLDPLVRNPSATLHGIALLLATYIQEQRRLAGTVQGLQQNLQGLQQNNQALQQNVHGLQQKLDALRTLERSLSERGEPAPRRR